MCPYPLKVHAHPPQDRRLATQSRLSGQEELLISSKRSLHTLSHTQNGTSVVEQALARRRDMLFKISV